VTFAQDAKVRAPGVVVVLDGQCQHVAGVTLVANAPRAGDMTRLPVIADA
jgi:hypothetical protein